MSEKAVCLFPSFFGHASEFRSRPQIRGSREAPGRPETSALPRGSAEWAAILPFCTGLGVPPDQARDRVLTETGESPDCVVGDVSEPVSKEVRVILIGQRVK